MANIQDRKKDHIDLTTGDDTQYRHSSGFDRYRLAHNALPEVNSNEVTTEAILCDRTFSMPLFISSMTGGYAEAGPVNRIIARVCQDLDLPFGVGSQRAMLEDESLEPTFTVVREEAPDAFIAANIGGAQLIGGLSEVKVRRLTESIAANMVIVHLNPLQELMQPEGDRDFKGILSGIEELVRVVNIPVAVKETGAGINAHSARRLLNAGVTVIDVAGSGGTSWSRVENERSSNPDAMHLFDEWGIPTVDCLTEVAQLKWERSFELISSGGIRSSLDLVKSLCLGADFGATAQPVIKAIKHGGAEALYELLERWKREVHIALTLLGCSSPADLSVSHITKIEI